MDCEKAYKSNADIIKSYQIQRAKEYLDNCHPTDGSEPSLEWCIISDLYRMIKEK